MTSNPQDPTREVPVTEIIPPGSSSAPAHHSSSAPSDHGHRLPASLPVLPPSRTGPRLPWLIGIVTLLALIGAGIWYWWMGGTPPVQYKTALVDRGAITAIVTATGTVNPVMSVQVGSQISGKITQLMVDFNSVVMKGQVLATIDPQPFQARVSQARASLKRTWQISGNSNLIA
jgi:HlyD family secretion protein